MLGLGRALGETMAVTFVIGNAFNLPESIFSPSNSIASALANEFNEAGGIQKAALLELGLILFISPLLCLRSRSFCCFAWARTRVPPTSRRLFMFNTESVVNTRNPLYSAASVLTASCFPVRRHGTHRPVLAVQDHPDFIVQGRRCTVAVAGDRIHAGAWCKRRPAQRHHRKRTDGGGRHTIGTPIGVLAGTYSAEYGQRGWLAPATRFLNDVLLSAPSHHYWPVYLPVYVAQVGHYSGWAGAFALAILVIPVVVRSTDNMLQLVPNSLREAAAALGCPKWRVIMFVCYRAARSGIITGVLLAIARISGETAPLAVHRAHNNIYVLEHERSHANLPVVIFQYAASPSKTGTASPGRVRS